MILKWILCHPAPGRRDAYLGEQAVWNRETFAREPVRACVMAAGGEDVLLLLEWDDQADIDRFMAGTHEDLMRTHPLQGLLRGYEVAYLRYVADVARAPAWDRVQAGSAVIRHTACTVPDADAERFLQVQEAVWSPGMGRADGFAGGRIWRVRETPERWLLATFFASAAAHAAYRANVLPRLRAEGGQSLQLSRDLTGREFAVLDARHR